MSANGSLRQVTDGAGLVLVLGSFDQARVLAQRAPDPAGSTGDRALQELCVFSQFSEPLAKFAESGRG